MEITERVNSLVQSYLDDNGVELVDITYKREQGGMMLRLLVDTADGITLNECESLNNYLSELLDREDFIAEHYTIEVASPGLDRALVTDEDFMRVMDKELDVRLYEPIDGKRERCGRLVGIREEDIVIEADGISVVLPRTKIAKARLKLDF